jgi:hypothetical protein
VIVEGFGLLAAGAALKVAARSKASDSYCVRTKPRGAADLPLGPNPKAGAAGTACPLGAVVLTAASSDSQSVITATDLPMRQVIPARRTERYAHPQPGVSLVCLCSSQLVLPPRKPLQPLWAPTLLHRSPPYRAWNRQAPRVVFWQESSGAADDGRRPWPMAASRSSTPPPTVAY